MADNFVPPQRSEGAIARTVSMSTPPEPAGFFKKKTQGIIASVKSVGTGYLGAGAFINELGAAGSQRKLDFLSGLTLEEAHQLPGYGGMTQEQFDLIKSRLASGQSDSMYSAEFLRDRQEALRGDIYEKAEKAGVDTQSISFNIAVGLGESAPLMPFFMGTNALAAPLVQSGKALLALNLLAKGITSKLAHGALKYGAFAAEGALTSPLDTVLYTQVSEGRMPTSTEYLYGLALDSAFSAALPAVQATTGAAWSKSKVATERAAQSALAVDQKYNSGKVTEAIIQSRTTDAALPWYQKRSLTGKATGAWDSFKVNFSDAAFKLKKIFESSGASTEQMRELQTLLDLQTDSAIYAEYGLFNPSGVPQMLDEVSQIKGLPKNPISLMSDYLHARRIEDDIASGIVKDVKGEHPLLSTPEARRELINQFDALFGDYADVVYKYQSSLLKLKQEQGIVTPEEVTAIQSARANFVPIRTVKEAPEVVIQAITGSSTGLKKAGDTINVDNLENVFQSIWSDTQTTASIIRKNDLKRFIVDTAQELGIDVRVARSAEDVLERRKLALERKELSSTRKNLEKLLRQNKKEFTKLQSEIRTLLKQKSLKVSQATRDLLEIASSQKTVSGFVRDLASLEPRTVKELNRIYSSFNSLRKATAKDEYIVAQATRSAAEQRLRTRKAEARKLKKEVDGYIKAKEGKKAEVAKRDLKNLESEIELLEKVKSAAKGKMRVKPHEFKKINKMLEPRVEKGRQLLGQIQELAGEVDTIAGEQAALFREAFALADSKTFPGENTVTLRREGINEKYVVPDEIYEYLSMSRELVGETSAKRFIEATARWFKRGTTGANISRIPREFFWNIGVIGSHLEPAVLKQFMTDATGFYQALLAGFGKGDLFEKVLLDGGLTWRTKINTRMLKKDINTIIQAQGAKQKLKTVGRRFQQAETVVDSVKAAGKVFEDLLGTMEGMQNYPETVLRLHVYQSAFQVYRKQGLDVKQARMRAAQESRRVLPNYGEVGRVVKSIEKYYPYTSSAISGLKSFWRAVKRDPKTVIARYGMLYGLPAFVLYTAALSDPKKMEAYLDIREWEFDQGLIWITDGAYKDDDGNWSGVFQIPIPPEAIMFANISRKMVEAAHGVDPLSVRDIAAQMGKSLSPVQPNPGTLVPIQAQGITEVMLGRTLFTGSELNYNYEAERDASTFAKIISAAIDPKDKGYFTPKDAEHLFKSYFGGVYMSGVNVVDHLLFALGAIGVDDIGGKSFWADLRDDFYAPRGGQVKAKEWEEKEKAQREKEIQQFFNQ